MLHCFKVLGVNFIRLLARRIGEEEEEPSFQIPGGSEKSVCVSGFYREIVIIHHKTYSGVFEDRLKHVSFGLRTCNFNIAE